MMVVLVALLAVLSSPAQPPNICATNATIGRAVIASLNLSWPGLETVKSAAASEDLGAACTHLAAYYRNSSGGSWLRGWPGSAPKPSTKLSGGEADDAVEKDLFHLGGVGQTAVIPRNADGGLDWCPPPGKTHAIEFLQFTRVVWPIFDAFIRGRVGTTKARSTTPSS